jgi:hypothetical protein
MPKQRLELLYVNSHDTPDLGAILDRGLDGLMIRIGQGGDQRDKTGTLNPYIDAGFLHHRLSALTYGLPYGVVYQCASLTEEAAEREAEWLVGQLRAIRDEIGLYVALQIEDLPQHPKYANNGKYVNERVLRTIAGRLTLDGFRVLIYVSDRSLAHSLPHSIFKTYEAYVSRPGVAERVMRSVRFLKPVIWEYGTSILAPHTGCACFGEVRPVALKRIRVTTGAPVRLIAGTKLYANAKDPNPCSILGARVTRYIWSDKKRNGKYAITLLAQFAEKPSRITCYVAERDIEIGILRERIDA